MMSTDYDSEPVHGLPITLPEGERILWQGAPRWRTFALHACHVRSITFYFALLMAWRAVSANYDGRPLAEAAGGLAWLGLLLGITMTFLCAFAYGVSRTTVYTITNRRVALRFGIALPKAVNIPFNVIQTAGVRRYGAGAGDLPLTLVPGNKIGYLILWPHARPWRLKRPEPMLRAIPNVDAVAKILADALALGSVGPLSIQPETIAKNGAKAVRVHAAEAA